MNVKSPPIDVKFQSRGSVFFIQIFEILHMESCRWKKKLPIVWSLFSRKLVADKDLLDFFLVSVIFDVFEVIEVRFAILNIHSVVILLFECNYTATVFTILSDSTHSHTHIQTYVHVALLTHTVSVLVTHTHRSVFNLFFDNVKEMCQQKM